MPHRTACRATAILVLLAAALLWPRPAAADLESELNDRWRGAWVVLRVAGYSGCGDGYTDNVVRGGLVSGKGSHRFDAGELAVVHRVRLKRKRVEVLVDLAEPLLAPRRDGPFTLYDELLCNLELELPRPPGPEGDRLETLDDRVLGILERHSDPDSARRSERWNRRQRQPYPPDYDRTLAEYEVWKATQINVAVQAKIDESLEEASRIVDRLDDEPEFLAGFARGVDEARDGYFGDDCGRLLELSRYSFVESAPKDESRDWRRGFEEGQTLVFHLEVGRRLRHCFVPVTPPSF